MTHSTVVGLHEASGKDFDGSVLKWRDMLQANCKRVEQRNVSILDEMLDDAGDSDSDDESEDESSENESEEAQNSEDEACDEEMEGCDPGNVDSDMDTDEETISCSSNDEHDTNSMNEQQSTAVCFAKRPVPCTESLASACIQVVQPPEVLLEYQDVVEVPKLKCELGFKICGDNIDKNVNSRYLRLERQNTSLHYFHMFAVQNRINFSEQNDQCPVFQPDAVKDIAKSILPSLHDDQELKKNIGIIVSRILVKHLKFFKLSFDDLVQWHIKHPFYEEMSSKSTVVSYKHFTRTFIMQ